MPDPPVPIGRCCVLGRHGLRCGRVRDTGEDASRLNGRAYGKLAMDYWPLTLIVMIPALTAASWIDYRAHKVPNRLNASLAVAGLIMQGLYFGWWDSTAGMGVGYGLLGYFFGRSSELIEKIFSYIGNTLLIVFLVIAITAYVIYRVRKRKEFSRELEAIEEVDSGEAIGEEKAEVGTDTGSTEL